jgi:tRNA(Ile2) C34 agmatinyltransferase TiaS
MSEAYARLEPTLIPMLLPLCPTCRGRMMLTGIEPGCDGPDLRIFECSKCGHVYNAPAEEPIKWAGREPAGGDLENH